MMTYFIFEHFGIGFSIHLNKICHVLQLVVDLTVT